MRSGVLHSAGTMDMQQCLVAYGAEELGAQVLGCPVGGRRSVGGGSRGEVL